MPDTNLNSLNNENSQRLIEESFSSGIEFLVKMAEKGMLDPKDIDIIDITDKFLEAISSQNNENLKKSGRILFHACVLLKLKALRMLTNQLEKQNQLSDDYIDFDDSSSNDESEIKLFFNRELLEKTLVRKNINKFVPKRKVTLEELIEALNQAEKLEVKKTNRKPKVLIDLSDQHDVNNVDDILELAHDEDIQSTIDKISLLIDNNLMHLTYITFVELNKLLGQDIDWVDNFLGLLFLSNYGKVELQQDKFYDTLNVKLHCDTVND